MYIENVLEELDIGREWFFNETTFQLFYKPNATTPGPPEGLFVATNLKVKMLNSFVWTKLLCEKAHKNCCCEMMQHAVHS